MSNWQSTIDLKDLFEKHDNDKISLAEVVKETLERCRQNQFYPKFKHNVTTMQDALDWFNNKEPQIEDDLGYLEYKFDEFMDNMYDFGDFQYRIWIKTAF